MLAVKWTREANGVAVPEIDEEHQELFRLLEEIEQTLAREPNAGALVRELAAHTARHFSKEEKMMKARRYPAYAWHKSQHDVVRQRAAELEKADRQGDREAVLASVNYLAAWFKTHTAVSDRMMGAFLRTNPATGRR
jgi:hemerythrin